MFQKIVVAADGSEHSVRAAEKAVAIAQTSSESIVDIIYVIDGATSKSDVLSNYGIGNIAEKRKGKLKSIEELLVKAEVKHQFHFIHGEPGPAIVKFANENNIDLVVIGSRGLNALQEMVLGSVSHKVAKRANCPVMIVK